MSDCGDEDGLLEQRLFGDVGWEIVEEAIKGALRGVYGRQTAAEEFAETAFGGDGDL